MASLSEAKRLVVYPLTIRSQIPLTLTQSPRRH